MTDTPTDWIKDAGWYSELRKTARLGPDEQFDALLARLLSEHARTAIEESARAGEGALRERMETLAGEFARQSDRASVRELADPSAYARRVVWDRAGELLRAALTETEARP